MFAFTYAQVDVTFQVDMSEYDGGYAYTNVNLNGSFNGWCGPCATLTDPEFDNIWEITVSLDPGTYEYKFTLDGWEAQENFSGGEPCTSTLGGFTNRTITVAEAEVLPVVCWNSCYECGYVTPEYDVTLSVDMNAFGNSFGNVYVSGTMNGWCGDCNQMLDPETDGIYEITLPLIAGSYEYKFTADNWIFQENFNGGEPCTVSAYGFTNRLLVVSETETLPTVCWESCSSCGTAEVTFQVDMSSQDVSPDGVFIAGSFQNWQSMDTPMTDAGNGIYTFTTTLQTGTNVAYKFINGGVWEDVPGECNYNGNRTYYVEETNIILDPVCFGSCEACEGGTTDLFFSEYYEGDYGNNKYVEIYNGTGGTVDLSNYRTHRISNGGTWDEYTYDFAPGAVIEDGAVYVIANDQSIPEIIAKADEFSGLTFFNGDDAVGLAKLVEGEWQMLDVIGTEGPDPGSGWEVAGVPNGTANHTLVRKGDVCGPNADWASSAGTNTDDSEWVVYPANTWDYLGFHNAVCGGSALVATPSFSVPGGNYLAAFDLEITCDTPDAAIFYTTDGSDPDQSSMLYTGSFNISTSTEVKAMAVAAGYGSSFTASASYVFPVNVANLAELRAAFITDPDGLYKVTGEVVITYQQTYRGQKFFQDATAGMMIDDPSGVVTTEYEIYDGITGMIGNLTEYGGMIEFLPVTDPGAASSSGNVITPEVITISDLNGNFEDYESELVQIIDVTFADAGASFSNGTAYAISDASKAEGFFRATFYNVDYIGTIIPPVPMGVTGICNSRFDGDYISSRDLNDLDIPDYIVVGTPNGGEQIEQGTDYEITWGSNVEGVQLTIELTFPDKASEILAENVAIEDGSFTWAVTQAYGDNYKVIIYATPTKLLGDESDDFFSIIPPIDVKITEIMYNTPGQDYWEFIELYNNGEGAVNLLDWKFTQGVVFTFPEHVLNPGEFVVTCIDAEAFLNTFGIVAYEWSSGGLGNSGEDIELTDNNDLVRAYVDYDDGGNWHPLTDGEGPSLTFCDPTLENNDPANWSASTKFAALTADGDALYCTPMAGCNIENTLPMFYSYGWTTMSSNLEPAKITMEDLFTPVNAKMIILLNDMGIYWPVQGINTIGDWDSYKGYKVKFNDGAYFVFSGTEMTNKVFEHGIEMTFVPVLSTEPVSLLSLIPQFEENVEFMFDLETGNVYWPEGSIVPGFGIPNALETLMPGHAYFTKFTAPGSIDFGAVPVKAYTPSTYQFENTTSWNDVSKTGEQHIISVSETALQGLESGDMIGAFNAQGVCVGMANYSGEETVLPLVVYGDDMTTEAIDGMLEGENLSFRIYRSGEEINAAAIYNMQIQNHDGLYAENGLSMINEFKLGATGMGEQNNAYSIYPNPGNGQFNIDVTGSFEVTISNAQGQMVYKGQINGNAVINLSDQSEGIYFIKLTGENATMIEKVIIK